MLDLIEEIEKSITVGNLRCALGMALTLPDICAHVEFPDEKRSQIRYENWCKKYLFNQGYLPSHEVDRSIPSDQWKKIRAIEPEMCYKLRCAFLHSGNLELNQLKNDDFPVFNLQITSTKENGIYTGMNMKDQAGELKELKIDIRLLTRVLCNAAKEYYESCPKKDQLKNHHVNIVDIEQEAKLIERREDKVAEIQSLKNNKKNYDELTDQAKIVLFMLNNGQAKDVLDYIKSGNDDFIIAMEELIDGDFVTIPPREDLYG